MEWVTKFVDALTKIPFSTAGFEFAALAHFEYIGLFSKPVEI
jgi:hypothetical protein